MNKETKRCSNGHFYDAEKFAECPFCQQMAGGHGSMRTTEFVEGDDISKTVPSSDIERDRKAGGFFSAAGAKFGFNRKRTDEAGDMQRTVSFYSAMESNNIELTVGVLLCISGPDFGATYLLKSGKNFIGRDAAMDVVLGADQKVSRYRHAIVVYEPKQRMFLAQPGESSELLYVNNKVVLEPLRLYEYDELSVGDTSLLFVPICGSQFSWDEYLG